MLRRSRMTLVDAGVQRDQVIGYISKRGLGGHGRYLAHQRWDQTKTATKTVACVEHVWPSYSTDAGGYGSMCLIAKPKIAKFCEWMG